MPLNTPGLKAALISLFTANLSSPTAEQTAQIETMCDGMATAMTAFVESATIVYSTGLISAAPGAPVTGVSGMVIT